MTGDPMLNRAYRNLCILLLAFVLVPAASAQITKDDVGTDKLAQTGFKFLKVSSDARVAAMSGAVTATDFGSSVAMFYNPAGMASQTSAFSASFGLTDWISDFSYNAASLSYNAGGYGVFGVSVLVADYGNNFIGTVQAANDRGYMEYSELGLSNPSPSAMSVGFGYAKAVTDRFAVGGNVKYVSQDLGVAATGDGLSEGNEQSALAFDFGVLYKTGFRSLNLAMSVRNFAKEMVYIDENFELPLEFAVGLSMNVLDLTAMGSGNQALNVTVEAGRPRDYAEQMKVGLEYAYSDLLFVRGGYVFPTDEEGISLGAGVRHTVSGIDLGVDYAYTTFGVFENVQRFGLQLHF